jgi:GGDEF domain-containing protein
VGVSFSPGLGAVTTIDLVARADEALYAAKRTGGTAVAPTGGRPRSIR